MCHYMLLTRDWQRNQNAKDLVVSKHNNMRAPLIVKPDQGMHIPPRLSVLYNLLEVLLYSSACCQIIGRDKALFDLDWTFAEFQLRRAPKPPFDCGINIQNSETAFKLVS